jgi:hypothetical protein
MYGATLLRGAVLVDREDQSDKPRLLAAIETEILDGAGEQVDRRFGYFEIVRKMTAGPVRPDS